VAPKTTDPPFTLAPLPPPNKTTQAAGNAAFSAGDWRAAIDAFGKAIALDETNHVLYSNRSAALVRFSVFCFAASASARAPGVFRLLRLASPASIHTHPLTHALSF
jgi:hypothetical protein